MKKITVKQKVNGWVKFIEFMIKFYTSDIQRAVCSGVDSESMDIIQNSVYRFFDLICLYNKVVNNYNSSWCGFMLTLEGMKNDLGERIHEISIDKDVLDAMLYDVFVNDTDELPF